MKYLFIFFILLSTFGLLCWFIKVVYPENIIINMPIAIGYGLSYGASMFYWIDCILTHD